MQGIVQALYQVGCDWDREACDRTDAAATSGQEGVIHRHLVQMNRADFATM
jgi:hypothetical protein